MRINICLDIEITPKEILEFNSKNDDLDVDKVYWYTKIATPCSNNMIY